jgi:hypothetical protein
MTVIVMRRCPTHGPQSTWLEAWLDPEDRRRGREYRCRIVGESALDDVCDLVLGRPTEYTPLEQALEAVKKSAARTTTPRLIRDQVERELKRRRKRT